MEKIKCPCCGGETQNYLNCDYCGSYLVRFKKRDLPYDSNKLGPEAEAIKGLQEELQANLDEQISTQGRNHINTKITCEGAIIEIKNPRAVGDFVRHELGYVVYPTNPYDSDECSIVLVLRFLELSDSFWDSKSNSFYMDQFKEKQKLEWFEHTGISNLFAKCDDDIYNAEGVCHSYYMNFGMDCAGASKVISQFLFGQSGFVKDNPNIKYQRESFPEIVYQNKVEQIESEMKKSRKKSIYLTILYILLAILCFYYFLSD